MSSEKITPSPTVPLGYHKAFHYVLLPIGMILSLIGLFANGLESPIALIFNIVLLGLLVATFVGLFKWKTWSYITMFIALIYGIVIYAIALAALLFLLLTLSAAGGFTSYYYGSSHDMAGLLGLFSGVIWIVVILCIVIIAVNVYTMIYYHKRKQLFYGVPNQYQVMQMHKMGDAYGQPIYGNQPYGTQPYGTQQSGYGVPQNAVADFTSSGLQNQARPQNPEPQSAAPAQGAGVGFCPQCGSGISNPDARFCPKCGSGL